MNKKILISIKALIVTCTIIFTSALVIFFGVMALKNMAHRNDEWIGSLIGASGNLIGGVLSAVVAYYVANLQVQKNMELVEKQEQKASYISVLLIIEEINYNNLIFGTVSAENFDQYKSLFESQIQTNQWHSNCSKLGKDFDSSLINKLYKIYSKIDILKSPVNTKKSYSNVDQLIKDCNTVLGELEQIKKELETELEI